MTDIKELLISISKKTSNVPIHPHQCDIILRYIEQLETTIKEFKINETKHSVAMDKAIDKAYIAGYQHGYLDDVALFDYQIKRYAEHKRADIKAQIKIT